MSLGKTKIPCSWDQCSAWIEGLEDRGLLIERYDYSGQHGGDESTFWQLAPEAVPAFLQHAGLSDTAELAQKTVDALIELIEEHDIPHRKWRDSMV